MRRKKKDKQHIWYICIIIALLLAILLLEPWSYFQYISYDKQWPYHDETSGNYDGDYDGIDISRHQGNIRWDELKGNRHIKFIYIKATEGMFLNDPAYKHNILEARKHGFKVGSYHFLCKGALGELQFLHFCHTIKKNEQDLLPMIDIEEDGTKGWSKRMIRIHLKGFIRACKIIYGVTPIIYCSQSYYKDYLSPDFDNCIHFIASYNGIPILPGKTKYDIWQSKKHGRIPGIYNWVDIDKLSDSCRIENIEWK